MSPSPTPVRSVQFIALSASATRSARTELFLYGWCRHSLFIKASSAFNAGHLRNDETERAEEGADNDGKMDAIAAIPNSIRHTYVTCDEQTLLQTLLKALFKLPVSSAIVIVPPSVRLSIVMEMLSVLPIAPRAISEHVGIAGTHNMLSGRDDLADWMSEGKVGAPAVMIANTQEVRSVW